MKKIMFDTNIFDKLSDITDEIEQSIPDYQYYVTTIQVEELCEIPDKKMEERKMKILTLAAIRAILVPISVFVLNGRGRLGYVRSGGDAVYHEILTPGGNNEDDAVIAATAVFEECTLITEDKSLYQKMKKYKHDVMFLDEFLLELQSVKKDDAL